MKPSLAIVFKHDFSSDLVYKNQRWQVVVAKDLSE
jgi:hypothetical protein